MGFTLIELLVVIAIIGVLIALLLPAVQQAREAARRTQCTNNLKQLGLAFHNYHDANKVFPGNGVLYSHNFYGWVQPQTFLAMLLPYLDQSSIYDRLNMSPLGWNTDLPRNKTAYNSGIAAFVCPSDPSQSNGFDISPGFGPSGQVQMTNYVGVLVGPWTAAATGPWQEGFFQPKEDPFWYNNFQWGDVNMDKRKERDVTDGLSRTYIVVEKPARYKETSTLQLELTQTWISPIIYYAPFLAYSAQPWQMAPTTMVDRWPINIHLPQLPPYNVTNMREWFGSFHPGGVNGLACDGSVQFISQSIDRKTMRALATIGKGDNVTPTN